MKIMWRKLSRKERRNYRQASTGDNREKEAVRKEKDKKKKKRWTIISAGNDFLKYFLNKCF